MRKALLGLLGLCGYSICSVGQVGLYLTAGTDLSINSSTVFSVDGLVLEPFSPFDINGPNSLTRDASIVHTTPQRHIFRLFHFANTSNSFIGNVGFYYTDSELNDIAESDLTLYTHNSSVWQFFAPVSRDAGNNIVITNSLPGISLSELTLMGLPTPLPLSWGPVRAQREQQAVIIKWETANESAVAFFQVEHSLDGISWTVIDNRVRASNTPGKHQYELLDATAPTTQTYYRIKQVAINRSVSYSSVVTVEALAHTNEVLVYPNPTASWVSIQAGSQLMTSLKLYDATGRIVRYEKLPNSSMYSLDISGLPKGTYQLELLFTNGATHQQSLLKQ